MGYNLDTFLCSRGAQALSRMIEDLATEFLVGVDSQNDANELFSELRAVMARSLLKAAATWNASHDRMRLLPMEIQELCFDTLPVSQKCQLSLICSHWMSTSRSLAALWNRLDLTNCRSNFDLGPLLARSGQLPLDLGLKASTNKTLLWFDRFLKANAHRLRSLALTMAPTGDKSDAIFRYPVPLLETLSLTYDGWHPGWDIDSPDLLFDGHAPRLHSLRLDAIPFPAACPAFANVTSAILGRVLIGLSNVFYVMPSLQHLTIDLPRHSQQSILPSVPPSSGLRSIALSFDPCNGHYFTVAQLNDLGYLDVASCAVSTYFDIRPLKEWVTRFSQQHCAAPPTLTIGHAGGLALHVTPDNQRTLKVCVPTPKISEVQDLFTGSAALRRIERLELPRVLSTKAGLVNHSFRPCLPSLRMLAVRCDDRVPRSGALLDITFLRTPLVVPALARLELLADAQADGPLQPIDAATLAAFVEDELELDDRGNLEVFVDTPRGVLLDGDVQLLRRSVSKLLI
ncbi:hypothetical protein AURDEDRAFT_175975 [Auricularia subglabra TFB-10046 SS5]|nr:hypothetical protein AURDEDRAFT_175975 [Auricularia subglabra TFB-10046 SS5]